MPADDDKITITLSPEDRATINTAAMLLQMSPAEFVKTAAINLAVKWIEKSGDKP